jgi:hypothetical protein
MTVPTRAELNAEVERQFHEQHPEAPAQLDPNDSNQASLVEAWTAIRDTVVNQWTDTVFYEHFPSAGKLDPNNPADQQLVEYWLDIRNQIRDDASPRWNWAGSDAPRGDGGSQAATSTQAATRLVSVTGESGGYLLTFDGSIDADAVGRWLWSSGVPSGVQLTARSATEFLLTGLTSDAFYSMNADVQGMIAQAGVITSEPYDPSAAKGGGTTTQPSDVKVVDEAAKREIEEHIKDWLEGTHTIASTAEVTMYLTEAGANLGSTSAAAAAQVATVVAEILAPLGALALVVWTGFEVIDAFKEERRREELQGYVYGVMWQALDQPDQLPEFAPGITYSAEEHKEAFVSGVQRGREKASDPKVRNRIIITVAIMGEQTGFGELWAAQQVLSEIWRANRERAPGETDKDLLMWPKPYDRTVLGH